MNTPDGEDLPFDPREFEQAEQPADTEAEKGPDPFDPASLRLSDEALNEGVGVKEAVVSIRCRKPNKTEFVRVHSDQSYRLQTYVIELKDDREVYLVKPSLWPHLAGEPTFVSRALYTTINRQGEVFIWYCSLPKPDGKQPDWITIPLEAAQRAQSKWVKMAWDEGHRRHRIWEASGNLGEPAWPDLTFRELLQLAFKENYIDRLDHPVLRRLRGEV